MTMEPKLSGPFDRVAHYAGAHGGHRYLTVAGYRGDAPYVRDPYDRLVTADSLPGFSGIEEKVDHANPNGGLSLNQAAVLMGVRRQLLRRLLDDGRIPSATAADGRLIIERGDVEAYVADRDHIAEQVAQARRDSHSINQEIADELGLDPTCSRRLGLDS